MRAGICPYTRRMTQTAGGAQFVLDLPAGFRIHTDRLHLVPASHQLVGNWQDRARLSQLLDARVPDEWPPELVEDYDAEGDGGWWDWYVLKRDADRPTLVGVVGLKGWPEVNGSVQIGCAFMPEFQRQGYGAESITAFVSWLLSCPRVQSVTARVPAGHIPSVAILRKIGFAPAGPPNDAGLIRFEKARA